MVPGRWIRPESWSRTLRAMNRRTVEALDGFFGDRAERLVLMCECSLGDCEEMLEIARHDWDYAQRVHGGFVVRPEHVREPEIVVAHTESHWAVLECGRVGAPARVLIVDDEYGARLQVELALTTSNRVEVVGEASNGYRGAELAESLQPDIVVLDLSMPGMDGFEALPLIRALAPNAKVLIRSNEDAHEHEERLRRLGAVGFVPKFIAPDDLRRVVEQVAEAGQDTRALITELTQASRARVGRSSSNCDRRKRRGDIASGSDHGSVR